MRLIVSGVIFLALNNEHWRILQAYIEKEVMPFECNKINKRYNISHIRYAAESVLGFDITSGLMAQLLRQRGVPHKDIRGITHFAVSDEFFNEYVR